MHQLYRIALLSVPFLIYFHFNFIHYPPKTLVIAGHADTDNVFHIQWDSGYGYRGFEETVVTLPAGDFSIPITLPQEPISSVKISPDNQATIKFSGYHADIDGKPIDQEGRLSRKIPLIIKTPFFLPKSTSWFLVIWQLLVAVFSSWGILRLKQYADTFQKSSVKDTLRSIFVEEQRIYFWSFWAISTFVHLLWLGAYYPAAMTNDSWTTMHDVKTLTFGDWHPYVYTFYVLFFLQFFNSVAAVAFGQIVLTSLLTSYILYYCVKRTAPRWVIFFFFIYFTTSIPIGGYNLMIWKDIPFSIAVFCFSFVTFYVAQRKRETNELLTAFPGGYLLFSILLVLLFDSRHNGKIFFVIAPLLLYPYCSQVLFRRLIGMIVGIYLVFHMMLPSLLNITTTGASPYHEFKTALWITTHYNFFSKDRDKDFKTLEEASGVPWDQIKAKFPQSWYKLWDTTKLAGMMPPNTGYTESYNKAFIARLVKDNIPIFLATRFYEFLHSIGLDSSQYNAWTNYYENPLQLQGSNLEYPGKYMYGVAIGSKPISQTLHNIIDPINYGTRYFDGGLSISVFVWNLAIWIGFMALGALLTEFSHPFKLFVAPIFFAAFAVFLAGAGESWRYFYYIYLTGIVTVPLFLASLYAKKPRN